MRMGDDDGVDRGGTDAGRGGFCGSRPMLGAKWVPPPASTRMSFWPVLISQVLSGVVNPILGKWASRKSFSAPASSPVNMVASSASVPSLTTVTS